MTYESKTQYLVTINMDDRTFDLNGNGAHGSTKWGYHNTETFQFDFIGAEDCETIEEVKELVEEYLIESAE